MKILFEAAPNQLLIIVPKRVVPKAHDRNRFKRIVREYFRLRKATMKPGKWVVIAEEDVENCTNEEIRISLAKRIRI